MPSPVTIVTYHRIALPGDPDLADALIDAYPPDFEAQMRYLAGRYTVISAWDLVRALREDYRLPERALVITFDDGYRCFQDTALPILRRLGLPVTLFVPTAYPGDPEQPFWWDAIYRAVMRTSLPALDVPGLALGDLTHEDAVELLQSVSGDRDADAAHAIVDKFGASPHLLARIALTCRGDGGLDCFRPR